MMHESGTGGAPEYGVSEGVPVLFVLQVEKRRNSAPETFSPLPTEFVHN
jgi:hypothetical protein